ncbi:Flagellar hook-length control protein FliK [Minicystis rosea]|nr:Flagellar hook-length control protein FliK [Minicystis rosea]
MTPVGHLVRDPERGAGRSCYHRSDFSEVLRMSDRRPFSFALLLALGGAAFAAACGGSGGTGSTGQTFTTGSGGHGGSTGHGGVSDGGSLLTTTGTGQTATLAITPQDPILDVTGSPGTLQLSAVMSDGSDPGKVTWDIGDVVVGTVSQTGVFTSPGFVSGVAHVTASALGLTATTNITVRVHITDNPGNVSTTDQTTLQAGGGADGSFRFLYPYDGTVFPRALRAPEMQLGGTAADATYVKISFGNYLYEGYFGASNPVRATLPQDVWKGLTQSAQGTDPVKVEVTKLSGGQATGPVSETWKVAPGSFKGIIYYNTYLSKLTNTGAVMRVRPNKDAEVFIGGCTVCHSVSANGNVLAAGINWTVDNPLDSGTFDIASDGTQTSRYTDSDGRKYAFGALTPNGDFLLASGIPGTGSPIRGLAGAFPSRIYDTKTGALVSAPTLDALVTNALTPAFSPDGKKVAFNHWDQGGGKTLGVMDFDGSQSPPVFSNLATVATATRSIAGWPSFLPDTGAVVYHDGDAFDTSGGSGVPRYAELRLVDLATQNVSTLGALNGRHPDNTFYLPYGEGEEGNLDYEPTVLPIPVGGYYWVVFTSRRAYGNTIAAGGTVPGGDNKWGSVVNGGEVPSVRKKLWVAAIDLDYTGKVDPSHPAFYLGEQELEAGNMRAFVSLEPCKSDGNTCESAAECCNGFCRPTGTTDPDGNPITACVPPPGGCSKIDEACTTAADCCDTKATCINGRCALPPPQ